MRLSLSLLAVFCLTGLASSLNAQCVEILPTTDTIGVCNGSSLALSASGGTDYQWSPKQDFDDPTAENVILTPSHSGWYYLSGIVEGTNCTDSVYIELVTFEILLSSDETICPLDPVIVTFIASHDISEIDWNNDNGVQDISDLMGTTIRSLKSEEYIVTATIGECTLSDRFEIDVIPFEFELLTEDTLFLCLGDSVRIRHRLIGSNETVLWSSVDTSFTIEPPASALVKPAISTTYTATATFGTCILSTVTFVRVDSLPDTTLVVIPLKDPYCAGEQVVIFAQNADTLKYPDIMFQWFPQDGQIRDSTNTGNVLITLRDTTTFFRVMTNNACRDTSSVTLNVIPPGIPLSVTDTTLCPFDRFQVEILDPDVTDIEWMPATGLSCTNCLDPTVTVQTQPITYEVSGEKDGCPVGATLSVNIYPPYVIPISPSVIDACPGDMIQFNLDLTDLTNVQISVTGNGSVNCTSCPDPIVTYNGGQVQLIVTADEPFENFCGALGGAIIVMKPDETQQLPAVIVCANTPTIIPLGGFNFVNPVLSINNGTLSCTNCENPQVTISQTTTLFIDSESQNPNACRLRSSLILLVPAGDDVMFDLDRDPPYGQGDALGIALVTDPLPTPGTSYAWTVNGMPVSGNTASINTPLDEPSNVISVQWTNSFGCLQTADTTITTVPPSYRIPRAFTPGREFNTHFKVEITGNIEIIEMLVFNRWGQVVYEGITRDGWDGRRGGEPAPAEVYVYLIKLRQPNGRIVTEKGDVTLIR